MKLSKLFNGININYDNDIEINNISINSKEVKENDLFVAIKGYIKDGHDYIDEAINNGAKVIIVNKNRYNDFKDKNAYIIYVDNTREICAKIACNYYNNPSKSFTLIGITGTKGKTSTSYMLKNILTKAGKRVGLISTIASYINEDKTSDNDRTTPEPFILQKTFNLMKEHKCEYVIMEVSSQSLKLGRVDESFFDIGLFLNLSKEHVSKNEHKDINDYFLCKSKLFDKVNVGFTNIDDVKGKELIKLKPNCNFIPITIDEVSNIKLNKDNTTFIYNNDNYTIPIIGKYSVYNALFSIKVSEYLNIDKNNIIEGIKDVTIPGRSEIIPNNLGITIIIDYAHNAKSLESILTSLNNIKKRNIITVFGCAGNRDKSKRKEMGKISGKLSNYTIITTDNPETEDSKNICAEIEEGIKEITNNYEIIIDREMAIKKAIKIANKEDIILLAGKGHENYQIIGEEKIPFSEKDIIKELNEEALNK